MVGILTKTLVRSPVVRWILQARVRRKDFNDVIFVGQDFVEIKQVKEQGHLEHVARKTDFEGKIRAAKTFTNYPVDDEELFTKSEEFTPPPQNPGLPPQSVVLTLDSNIILFLWIITDQTSKPRFAHHAVSLPSFDEILFQPGEHIAVDLHSRALAVAANERELVLYSTKGNEGIAGEMQTEWKDWSPVIAQRPLQVEGVIQNMEFLIPAADDGDHIILLLLVIDQQKTKTFWLDWFVDWDLHQAQLHYGQLLDIPKTAPSLLIPLKNASFFLISGSEVTRWKNILCGSATVTRVQFLDIEVAHPGASPRQPIWTSWSRPKRSGGITGSIDHVYLVREDGIVYLLETGSSDVVSSHAGEMGCHTGSAFASLGDARDPDILICAGDMSSGRICSIGHWSTPLRVPELDRVQTMTMDLVETVPSWASVTDMVTSALPGKSQRVRDGLFVTSCRQPYGAITELRRGLEARLSFYFELEGLRSVTNIWALPLTSVGRVLLILSSPSGTRLLEVSPDLEMQTIDEVDETSMALDTRYQTLAAAVTMNGKLVQITTASICISSGIATNFEDTARINVGEGSTITTAAIDTQRSIAVAALRATEDLSYGVLCYRLRADDLSAFGAEQVQAGPLTEFVHEPLCLELISTETTTVALITTADGYLSAFTLDGDGRLKLIERQAMPVSSSGLGLCDSIVVLHDDRYDTPSQTHYLVVCGMRDGDLSVFSCISSTSFILGEGSVVHFSQSAAKLAQHPDDHSIAYAMSGLDTCLLSWSGSEQSPLTIESIYVTDKQRSEFGQGSVVACAHMPASHLLSSPDLAGSLISISGDEFLVASLDRNLETIPRQIPVNGTPNRLIYSEQQRCLVCASLRYETRYFSTSAAQAKPEMRRQLFPVIDFIPSRCNEPSFSYKMQPGERVYALLEWSFKLSEDKTYSFILVGGSYTRSSGSVKGRITFLQPVNKHWEVVDVKEGRTLSFEAPVYAMTLLDELTYVACTGRSVVVYRFSVNERKWAQICKPYDQLGSPGICISTVDQSDIYVSTTEDSFVKLLMLRDDRSPDSEDGYSYILYGVLTAERADLLLSHLTLDRSVHAPEMILASTRHGQLLASMRQMEGKLPCPQSAELMCEARLTQSLTRLRLCNTRPRWKADPHGVGVLVNNVIGCASDGTIVGIAVLGDSLLRRLSWLQRLCEWGEETSPHSCHSPAYSIGEQSYSRNERAMPIGLADGADQVVMRTARNSLNDQHIDGDVLARLLENGGVKILDELIRKTAERDDHAGEWVRQHLDDELSAVNEIIATLRTVLDCWL